MQTKERCYMLLIIIIKLSPRQKCYTAVLGMRHRNVNKLHVNKLI